MTSPYASDTSSPLLAIEIGGTKLQLVVGTRDGVILERRRFTVESARGAEGIRECIASALPELLEQWRPEAVGVGYGGPVNWRTGRIVKSYHLSGWNDFPLAEWLLGLSGLPVFVENFMTLPNSSSINNTLM
jgi:glucokinase